MFGRNRKNKTVIIGLDGVPYEAIKRLTNSGIMPATKELLENGTFSKMASSVPEISSVAWSSIITGCNPAEHGIFGFTDLRPNSYNLTFPNFNDLKEEPFWQRENDKRHIIINVPSTYPVKPLNGIHISGFVSVDFEKSVYPDSVKPKLKQMDYQIDVDAEKGHQSLEAFLEDLDKTLKARIKTYRYFWSNEKWDTFMLVFTGTDRLGHFLWDAFEDESHKYHSQVIGHFKQIDNAIGQISSNIKEDDLLVMLSDHGFEILEENVHVNYLLKEKGFLKIEQGKERRLFNLDSSTKAFALDPARIYINLKNKYPKGNVEEKDKQNIIDELVDIFSQLERNNKKVIEDIYTKDQIYHGPYIDKAADLVLVASKGFNLKAKVNVDSLYEKNIFKGKHSQKDAFFLANKKSDDLKEDFSVFDVLKTIKKLKE
jgi:predicted AlkP superfamily phosphohydrolase/phosphomutase